MHLIKLLTLIRKADLRLWTDGVRLTVKGPDNQIDQSVLHLLRARKKEIMAYLVRTRQISDHQDHRQPSSVAQAERFINQFFLPQSVNGHHIAQFRLDRVPEMRHLKRALIVLANRHPMLRARLHRTPDTLFISPKQAAPPTLTTVDLRHLSQRRKTHLMNHLLDTLRDQPGSLTQNLHPKPLCAHLFHLGDDFFIFCIRLHHLFVDTYSAALLLSEWKQTYMALCHDKTPRFERHAQCYSDALAWERRWLAHRDYQANLEKTVARLRHLDRSLKLPYDTPLHSRRSNRCNRFYLNLPGTLVTRLTTCAQLRHTSVEMMLLTAYANALACMSMQQRFMMAVPNCQRDQRWPNTVAQLGDMTLLPIDMSDPSNDRPLPFDQLLTQLTKSFQELTRAPWIPIPKIVSALNERPQKCQHPLTQVGFFFSYRHIPLPKHWHHVSPQVEISPLDLTFMLPAEGPEQAYLRFRIDAFKKSTVKLFAQRLQEILITICDRPHLTICQTLQTQFPSDLPQRREAGLIHDFFCHRVCTMPQTVACYFDNRQYTYRDLDKRINNLALHLANTKLPPQTPIGMYMIRHVDTLIALLAILKLGCIYVPLDPTHPPERRRQIIENAGLQTILASTKMQEGLPQHLDLIDPHPIIRNPTNRHWQPRPMPSSAIACLRYASGASGTPVGIAQTHASLLNNLLAIAQTIKFNPNDCLASVTNLSNPGADLEWLLPLISGASLAIVPRRIATQGFELRRFLERHPVTTLHATPFIWNRLLKSHWQKPIKALCFGESVSTALLRQFYEADILPWNLYQETLFPAAAFIKRCDPKLPNAILGQPLPHIQALILNRNGQPVAMGVPGRLCLVTKATLGYFHAARITACQLLPHPKSPELRIFATDKIARQYPNGQIQVLAHNLKLTTLGGHSTDLRDIENHLCRHESIQQAYVTLHRPHQEREVLLAYVVSREEHPLQLDPINETLRERLPTYMIPKLIIPMVKLPIDAKGRVLESLLPLPRDIDLSRNASYKPPRNLEGQVIARQWQEQLGVPDLSIYDSFFSLGGNRWQLLQAYEALPAIIKAYITMETFYEKPTIAAITAALNPPLRTTALTTNEGHHKRRLLAKTIAKHPGEQIAIIGIACRFPNAANPAAFWQNLVKGHSAIQHIPRERLLAEGERPDRIDQPGYVPFRGLIKGYQDFDAGFFELTPREAQITDPQQRLFLECAWEALEAAGYAPKNTQQTIGIFGGVGLNHYLAGHLLCNQQLQQQVGELPLMIGNGVDNLCTRVSFKLGLTGPGVVVQTNCSTSLVAVHLASQALHQKECDIALAGAVDLGELRQVGYLHESTFGLSKTGGTHPFDSAASGSVPGQGAGMVVLKRLADAIEDGDHIHAVIRGHAVNNDGSHKKSYTGYALGGQTGVLKEALKSAQMDPAEIEYIETSSSASPLGDQVELSGLRQAYGETFDHPVCLGAVKSSVGNLGIASGICALIKACLALEHETIPATLHHHQAHPKLNINASSYHVNTHCRPFQTRHPKVGVSSFGMGGTNAHLILEKPPHAPARKATRRANLICFSAKTPSALAAIADNLANHITENPHIQLADIAYTLAMRNSHFPYRRILVATNNANLVLQLQHSDSSFQIPPQVAPTDSDVAFLYPGHGVHYKHLAQNLITREPRFAQHVSRCKDLLAGNLEKLSRLLFNPQEQAYPEERVHLELFIFQYGLTRTLQDYGIMPSLLGGDRFGMLVAATIAETFDLADALELVIVRARLLNRSANQHHIAVSLNDAELQPILKHGAVLNSRLREHLVILSGCQTDMDRIKGHLKAANHKYRDLYHCPFAYLPEQDANRLLPFLQKSILRPPNLCLLNPNSGNAITKDDATDPHFWAQLLSKPFRPDRALKPILERSNRTLLEIAPSPLLATLVRQHGNLRSDQDVFTLLHPPTPQESDSHILMLSLGRLWLNGINLNGEAIHSEYHGQRIPLPTYPFERETYWVAKPHEEQEATLHPDELTPHFYPHLSEPHRPGVINPYQGPRNDLERQLSRAFCELLGLQIVGVHDNFFELGGDSFLALTLTDRLTRNTKVLITAQILLKKPTVAQLAAYIHSQKDVPQYQQQSTNPLVQLHKGDSKQVPLFLFHPIGGEVYFYRSLANQLPAGRPIYGIQATSLCGLTEPYSDLVAQASAYASVIQRLHPSGPYLLGGASYGGVLAYEIAQQLYRQGFRIPLLVLIDSPAPGKMPQRLHSSAEILAYLLEHTMHLDREAMSQFQEDEALLAWVMEQARQNRATSALPVHLGKPLLKTWMAHQTALHAYQPQAYPGDMLYFSATERSAMNPTNMHKAWQPLVKGTMKQIPVPGNHITMNHHRNVPIIANAIQKELKKIGQMGAAN